MLRKYYYSISRSCPFHICSPKKGSPCQAYRRATGASSSRSMISSRSVVVARRFRGDAPVLQRGFKYSAAVELIHRGAVDLLPGRLALREGGDALLPLAAFDLLLGDKHVAASGAQVDADRVARPNPGQAAASGALWRGVQDRWAVRST